jgi:hypothetical protein
MKAERVNYDKLESSRSGYEIFQEIRCNCQCRDSPGCLHGGNPTHYILRFFFEWMNKTKGYFSKFLNTSK